MEYQDGQREGDIEGHFNKTYFRQRNLCQFCKYFKYDRCSINNKKIFNLTGMCMKYKRKPGPFRNEF